MLALAVSSQVARTHPEFKKKKKKTPETFQGAALTLYSQSPAEHRCGVGMGAPGSVRMGTPTPRLSTSKAAPPCLQGEVLLPTPTAPPPQQATPISALWVGRRRLRRHGPLDRRVLGFRGSMRSQPRGVRGQECQPGPCLQDDHRPSQPEALLSRAQQARLVNFLKKKFL